MKHVLITVAIGVVGFFVLIPQVRAHGTNYPVIVDTDMALDDIRALTMLLNTETGQIQLMVASDGIRSPEEGARNLSALLHYFNKPRVPTAQGRRLLQAPPRFRSLIDDIRLPGVSNHPPRESGTSAAQRIVNTINSAKEPVIYVCLGPMTNLADALAQNSDIVKNISRVLYYGLPPNAKRPGWNTQRDPAAAKKVFGSNLRIFAFCSVDGVRLPFDEHVFANVITLSTPASKLIQHVHDTPDIKGLMAQKHFFLWDELVVLYMYNPALFHFSKKPQNGTIQTLTKIDETGVIAAFYQCFGFKADMHLSHRQAVVFDGFPKDPACFRTDVRPHVETIITKYGMEEWKACLLTNEFHRHLGMYSIVGAKMGVRAREVLGAPFDSLSVISHAGNRPPFSCLNDGLQVSTGASLGRGTIRIKEDAAIPKAEFVFNDTTLTLTLKQVFWNQIKADISALIKEYGGTTPEYFAKVRKLSITRWETWDRKALFEETLSAVRRSLPREP